MSAIKHKMFKKFKIYIILIFTLLELSCKYFNEPEPYVNTNAQPANVVLYPALNTQIGDTINGLVNIEFKIGIVTSEIAQVKLFIDSSYVITASYPFRFSIDTRQWSNGVHNILFAVYKYVDNIGLLRILDNPSLGYMSTIYFRNIPFMPDSLSISLNGSYPYLRWKEPFKKDRMFYIIRRYDRTNSIIHVDTLSATKSLEYMDTTVTLYIGTTVKYDIGAGNEVGVNFCNPVDRLFGNEAWLYTTPPDLKIIGGELENDVICSDGKTYVAAISGQTGGFIAEQTVTGDINAIATSLDESRVYVWVGTLRIIDLHGMVTGFYINRPYSYLRMNALVIGKGPRLWGIDTDGNIVVIDSVNSDHLEVTAIDHLSNMGSSFMNISPDKQTLLVVDATQLKKFSINGSSISLVTSINLGGAVTNWRVSWETSQIFINKGDHIESWSYKDFTHNNIAVPSSVSSSTTLTVNAGSVFGAYILQIKGEPCTLLIQYDKVSLAVIRQWILNGVTTAIAVSQKGRYLFADVMSYGLRYCWMVDLSGGESL